VEGSGVTCTGTANPTKRWKDMKRGLTTLHFRLHKGLYVPSPEAVACMNVQELQKPQAARIKEQAARLHILLVTIQVATTHLHSLCPYLIEACGDKVAESRLFFFFQEQPGAIEREKGKL
jgi:hypothetical protein